jgi:carboxyl-terminal processing protease
MKKLLLVFFSLILFSSVQSQNPSYKEKLYYTCKVWGFVKYFHSNVSVCGVNWDSVLVADLPLVKNAVTKNDFNNALDTMLKAAGPMALTTSPPCDTVPPELSRNLNFGWIKDTSIFRNDVFAILDTIKNNFRPHPECRVEVNPNEAYGGYLKFQSGDSLILNINDYTNYPDEGHKLLELFAYWNIINYFNPYNYILNQPWDSTLYQNVLNIDNALNDSAFYIAFIKITSNLDDGHVNGWTSDSYSLYPLSGLYSPKNLVLKYIPGKYIVAESSIPGLTRGDEIISVNGLTTKQWEDSLKPYISAGDSATFHEILQEIMIVGAGASILTITYYDSLNNIQTTSASCKYYEPFRFYYPNDSLQHVQWRYWANCNVGYINVGNMLDTGTEVAKTYSVLQNTYAIIFDIRNYPASSAVYDLGYYLNPSGYRNVIKEMYPDVTYPGTYYWQYVDAYGSSNPYTGKIIILFNEQTISAAEFASMFLSSIPNSIKIGSQTDGVDGAVTNFNLSKYMGTGFSSTGVFYANGDSTQRVGIIPDSLVYPTQAGIRAGRDELLEKALQVAGCPTSISTITKPLAKVAIYPNPSNGSFTLSLSNVAEKCCIEIYNVLGEKVYSQLSTFPKGIPSDNSQLPINISSQPNGIYLYRILRENGELVGEGKVVIEK